MKRILNNRGSGYFTPCVITLVIVMILAAVFFYANTMTIIQATKANTERVLDSFVMKNSIEIYQSIKQGHDFTEKFDKNYYVSQTSSELSLDKSSNTLYSIGEDGKTIYSMTNPNVTYKVDNALKLKASYNLMIPVEFAGKKLFDLVIPLTVTSSLTLKD